MLVMVHTSKVLYAASKTGLDKFGSKGCDWLDLSFL